MELVKVKRKSLFQQDSGLLQSGMDIQKSRVAGSMVSQNTLLMQESGQVSGDWYSSASKNKNKNSYQRRGTHVIHKVLSTTRLKAALLAESSAA